MQIAIAYCHGRGRTVLLRLAMLAVVLPRARSAISRSPMRFVLNFWPFRLSILIFIVGPSQPPSLATPCVACSFGLWCVVWLHECVAVRRPRAPCS